MQLQHPHEDRTFYVDDFIYNNILPLRKRIKYNKDVLFLVCGDPGNGKSTITSQVLYLLDPSFAKYKCIFSTMQDYMNYDIELNEKEGSKGKSIMHDEARETGSKQALTKEVKRFWDAIYENRFLNMYQALCQSDFFNVPRDIINSRARFMIWVEELEDWNNGAYYFFGRQDMKKYFAYGKDKHSRSPKKFASFYGKFSSDWCGHQDYLDIKKSNYFNKYKEGQEGKKLTVMQVINFILNRNPDAQAKPVSEILLCDRRTYHLVKQSRNEKLRNNKEYTTRND